MKQHYDWSLQTINEPLEVYPKGNINELYEEHSHRENHLQFLMATPEVFTHICIQYCITIKESIKTHPFSTNTLEQVTFERAVQIVLTKRTSKEGGLIWVGPLMAVPSRD